jgi:hypothetical protein
MKDDDDDDDEKRGEGRENDENIVVVVVVFVVVEQANISFFLQPLVSYIFFFLYSRISAFLLCCVCESFRELRVYKRTDLKTRMLKRCDDTKRCVFYYYYYYYWEEEDSRLYTHTLSLVFVKSQSLAYRTRLEKSWIK